MLVQMYQEFNDFLVQENHSAGKKGKVKGTKESGEKGQEKGGK